MALLGVDACRRELLPWRPWLVNSARGKSALSSGAPFSSAALWTRTPLLCASTRQSYTAFCVFCRNGFFSYRWSQIIDQGRIASETVVMKARVASLGPKPALAPPPLDEVLAAISAQRPAVVCKLLPPALMNVPP